MPPPITPVVPLECMARIREFLLAGLTGSIELNVKDGRVLAWKVTEHGRILTQEPTKG